MMPTAGKVEKTSGVRGKTEKTKAVFNNQNYVKKLRLSLSKNDNNC